MTQLIYGPPMPDGFTMREPRFGEADEFSALLELAGGWGDGEHNPALLRQYLEYKELRSSDTSRPSRALRSSPFERAHHAVKDDRLTLARFMAVEAPDGTLAAAAVLAPAVNEWARQVMGNLPPWAAEVFPQIVCELQSVAVLPQYRRRGIASALLVDLFTYAQRRGYRLAVWFYEANNRPAASLYENSGAACLMEGQQLMFALPGFAEKRDAVSVGKPNKYRIAFAPLRPPVAVGQMYRRPPFVHGLWDGLAAAMAPGSTFGAALR